MKVLLTKCLLLRANFAGDLCNELKMHSTWLTGITQHHVHVWLVHVCESIYVLSGWPFTEQVNEVMHQGL